MKLKHWIRIALIALLIAGAFVAVRKLLAFGIEAVAIGAVGFDITVVVVTAYIVVAHATRKP